MAKLALITFLFLGAALMATGTVYLTATEFMSYHSEAIGNSWTNLNSDYQGLYLGFLRGLGAGAFVVGVSVGLMSYFAFRGDVRPYLVLLPAVSLAYIALLTFATYTVYSLTPGNPPLIPLIVGLFLALAASILLWVAERNRHDA